MMRVSSYAAPFSMTLFFSLLLFVHAVTVAAFNFNETSICAVRIQSSASRNDANETKSIVVSLLCLAHVISWTANVFVRTWPG